MPSPALPLLRYQQSLAPTDWLQAELTTFAKNVASIVPSHFPAYARIYHPFETDGRSPFAKSTWAQLSHFAGRELRDPAAAADFAMSGVPNAQAPVGTLPAPLIDILLEYLAPATTTPAACYFAVWDGFGGSAVPHTLKPKLELPQRAYHVFAGPLVAARTSYSSASFPHQSANLWWPADQKWCVATEIDFAWTYVSGPRNCIKALLADPQLEAEATEPGARW